MCNYDQLRFGLLATFFAAGASVQCVDLRQAVIPESQLDAVAARAQLLRHHRRRGGDEADAEDQEGIKG